MYTHINDTQSKISIRNARKRWIKKLLEFHYLKSSYEKEYGSSYNTTTEINKLCPGRNAAFMQCYGADQTARVAYSNYQHLIARTAAQYLSNTANS